MGEQLSKDCSCSNSTMEHETEQMYHPSERQPFIDSTDSTTIKKQNKYMQDSSNAQNTVHDYSTTTSKPNRQNNTMQRLEIKITASATLKPDTILHIDYTGLRNSLRGCNDGFVFFGSKKRSIKFEGEMINDFIIPSIDDELSEKHRGNHFYIRYDENKNCYKMKDLGIGFGAFKQIHRQHVLKDNQLLNSGLLFITINTAYGDFTQLSNNPEMQNLTNFFKLHCFIDTAEGYQPVEIHTFRQFLIQTKHEQWAFLKLQFYGGHSNDEKYLFCTNISNGTITIGRGLKQNLISYPKDSLLSERQCSITYDNTKGWTLTDLESTNGVWVYVGEEIIINDGMKFKANHTMFQIGIHDN